MAGLGSTATCSQGRRGKQLAATSGSRLGKGREAEAGPDCHEGRQPGSGQTHCTWGFWTYLVVKGSPTGTEAQIQGLGAAEG